MSNTLLAAIGIFGFTLVLIVLLDLRYVDRGDAE